MNEPDGTDPNANVRHVVRQKHRSFLLFEDSRDQFGFLLKIVVNIINHHVGVVLGAIENADANWIGRELYDSTRRETTKSIALDFTSGRRFALSVVEEKTEPKKTAETPFQHDASLRVYTK